MADDPVSRDFINIIVCTHARKSTNRQSRRLNENASQCPEPGRDAIHIQTTNNIKIVYSKTAYNTDNLG